MQQKYKYIVRVGILFIAISFTTIFLPKHKDAANQPAQNEYRTPTNQAILKPVAHTSSIISIIQESTTTQATSIQSIPNTETPTGITATLKLPNTSYRLSLPKDASVYDLLQGARDQKGFLFTSKSYPALGVLIDSINGIKGGDQPGHYWIYYVNGKKAVIGISNYKLNSNDTVEWKYQSDN
jgi:hypothetical protein